MVLEAAAWKAALPHTIEAIFYPEGAGAEVVGRARRIREELRRAVSQSLRSPVGESVGAA